jgi:two-component system chemotaxis sensor kinase CheA
MPMGDHSGPRMTTAPKQGIARPSIPAPAAAGDVSLRSITQTVRVDIHRLDHLMNIVGELSIVKGAIGRLSDRIRRLPELREMAGELYRAHRSFERQLSDLQSAILEVRMVPLGQLFDRLARAVRQVSREAGKEVNLVITGGETEVDKLIVEELSDPLLHMIRNAIDHGIEPQAARESVGKPASGTIALNAFQKGSHVVIEIEDDGQGIDEARVLEAAIARGIVGADDARELARGEVLNLIFAPGVTTRADVGELSGRGVGMDVVKTNVGRLGGIIDVYSELGIGTKLSLTLPITLAIISALLVRVRQRVFAIPLSSVQEAISIDLSAVRRVEGREVVTLRGQTLALCRLAEVFGLKAEHEAPKRGFAVVAGAGARRLGFVVDELVGQQDIVIKSLGASLGSVKGFAGATELGDQRVVLVLDAPTLIEESLSAAEGRAGALVHG